MKKLLVLFCSLSLFAAMAQGQEQDRTLGTIDDGPDLEKVKRAKFRETYVNTAVDFTQYNKIYQGEALFDYRDAPPPQRYRSSFHTRSRSGIYGISEKDKERFEQMVSEAFDKELAKGKQFTITDTIDENTMYLRGALVDIVSRVPPEFTGSSEVYLATVGEATLVLELLDGRSGEVLARIAERGRIGRPGGQIDGMPANSVTIDADVRRWASGAARRQRSELDLAMKDS